MTDDPRTFVRVLRWGHPGRTLLGHLIDRPDWGEDGATVPVAFGSGKGRCEWAVPRGNVEFIAPPPIEARRGR